MTAVQYSMSLCIFVNHPAIITSRPRPESMWELRANLEVMLLSSINAESSMAISSAVVYSAFSSSLLFE